MTNDPFWVLKRELANPGYFGVRATIKRRLVAAAAKPIARGAGGVAALRLPYIGQLPVFDAVSALAV